MSFSLEVIVLLLGICTLRDFCVVWGLVWTDFKVAPKEKERFGSPPTPSPLLLLFRQPPLTEFWGCQCYEHLLQNNVNLARSPPFGGGLCASCGTGREINSSSIHWVYMAATVLTGTGTANYTNSTGDNVRVIINYFGSSNSSNDSLGYGISLVVGSASFTAPGATSIGKNLALNSGFLASSTTQIAFGNSINMTVRNNSTDEVENQSLPVEFYLQSGQTFSMSLGNGGTAQYNILVIPEAG